MKLVYEDYPEEGHRGWKIHAFATLMELALCALGAPCTTSANQRNSDFASITRIDVKST